MVRAGPISPLKRAEPGWVELCIFLRHAVQPTSPRQAGLVGLTGSRWVGLRSLIIKTIYFFKILTPFLLLKI